MFIEKIKNNPPYIIAEIGVNHGGIFEQAIELINLAHEGGANAAKFQSYKAEKIASKFSPSYWDTSKEPTSSQFELFKKYDSFGEQEYIKLYEHCKKIGIDFLSTPFDNEAIDFLDPLIECFKIASADITNVPFLRKVASKNKPIILSTGASNLSEIDFAIKEIKEITDSAIILMHCVLNYPTPDKNAHLGMITGLKHSYPNHLIGYSDHTMPDHSMVSLCTAYSLGAVVIEKHFTHDKTLPGNDHYHAMDVLDCRRFKDIAEKTNILIGNTTFKSALADESSARLNARRSIVAKSKISKNSIITEEMITYKRPAHGISPAYWDEVLGMKAIVDIEEDLPIKWSQLENPREGN